MSTSSQPQSTTVDAATIPLPANSPSTVSSSSAATSSAGSNPSFAVGYAAGSVVPNGVPYDPSTAAAYNAYAMQYMNTYQQTYPYAAAAYTQYYGYAPPEASGVSTTATAPNNESQTKVPMPSAKASCSDDAEDDDDDDPTIDRGQSSKASNLLPIWGNEKTMNLNSLVLTNILQSPYFKVNLFQLKTYHEVIDEIYYNVKHLEPWERGSRKVQLLCL